MPDICTGSPCAVTATVSEVGYCGGPNAAQPPQARRVCDSTASRRTSRYALTTNAPGTSTSATSPSGPTRRPATRSASGRDPLGGAVGDPRAVEAERHPLRQADSGDRCAQDVGGVEHDEVAGVTPLVVDDGEQPTLVFAGVVRRRYEHAFAGVGTATEAARFARAGLQIVLHQTAELDPLVVDAEVGREPVPMASTDDAVVHPRELLRPVVEPLLDDLPGVEVDRPPVQGRWQLGRSVDVGGEHLGMPGDVDDNGAACVVGVERVEDVARLDFVPTHVGIAAVTGHHAD